MSDNEEVYAGDVDWQATAETLQAEVTRLQIAAKAAPLTIDREALFKPFREMSDEMAAATAYDALTTPGPEAEYPVSYFREKLDEAIDKACAVAAHLSAQEAAAEVEWEYGIHCEDLDNVISVGAPWMDREYAERVSANDSGNYGARRRPAGPWQEVPADE